MSILKIFKKQIKKIFEFFKSKKKLVLIFLGSLIIVFFVFKILNPKKKILETTTVFRSNISDTFSASGRVKAYNQATLRFNIPSKVTWVNVQKGDLVSQWQAVAALDQRQLRKNLEKMLSLYMTSRWDFEDGRDEYDIKTDNLDSYTLSDSDRRWLEKNQFSLNRSVLDVEMQDIVLKESVLISPINGTVVDDAGLVVGEYLGASELASKTIRVVDLSSLYFEAKIDELDYAKVESGQKAEIVLDSFPTKSFAAKVKFVGKEGVESTGGVINILVDLNFDNYSEDLITDLNGEAFFITGNKENVLNIPAKYLVAEDGKDMVYVSDGKKPELREIKIGIRSSDLVEILTGLQENEEIVLLEE